MTNGFELSFGGTRGMDNIGVPGRETDPINYGWRLNLIVLCAFNAFSLLSKSGTTTLHMSSHLTSLPQDLK
jgi:hypothetical protein